MHRSEIQNAYYRRFDIFLYVELAYNTHTRTYIHKHEIVEYDTSNYFTIKGFHCQ